jgi:hypothetical protein
MLAGWPGVTLALRAGECKRRLSPNLSSLDATDVTCHGDEKLSKTCGSQLHDRWQWPIRSRRSQLAGAGVHRGRWRASSSRRTAAR